MKNIDLKCGISIQVDERTLSDMEFLDCLAEADNENPAAMSMMIKKLLGKEQKKKLYNTLRDDAGFVPIEAVSQAVVEIFNAMGEAGKN